MRDMRKRSSAICRVMGVGEDYAGKSWVLMERMGGDLRDLHDTHMHCVKDGKNAISLYCHHQDDDGDCTRDGGLAQIWTDTRRF